MWQPPPELIKYAQELELRARHISRPDEPIKVVILPLLNFQETPDSVLFKKSSRKK